MKRNQGVSLIVIIVFIVLLFLISGISLNTTLDINMIGKSKDLSTTVEVINLKKNIKSDIISEKNKTRFK